MCEWIGLKCVGRADARIDGRVNDGNEVVGMDDGLISGRVHGRMM